MLLLILSYLGGALTILSPCILPVLPFVFARSDRPFLRSGLPLLIGMVLTFGATATLAAVGGGWAVQANQYGRWIAIALLAVFGLTLLLPAVSDRVMRPLVQAGNWLSHYAQASSDKNSGNEWIASLLLGVATGMLWAPCAGPILGLVLTGAALGGASVKTTLLLVAYAAGAATSLGVALLIGGRVFGAMKRSLGTSEWLRKGLGVAVLCGVVMIALGLDTGLFAQLSSSKTAATEQQLLDHFNGPAPASSAVKTVSTGNELDAAPSMMMAAAQTTPALPIEGDLPSLAGAVQWLNSPPLTAESLRGKVVLVDFWTYSCINCLRTLPYVRAWAEKYKDQGLVVIGVHAPEFAFEKNIANVEKATHDLGVTYPVAIDNNYAIWRAFNNQYWPAHYFIDANGKIRHHHFGEGEYDESERIIQQLLTEAGQTIMNKGVVEAAGQGVQLAGDGPQIQSPETYLGYARAENFASDGGQVRDASHTYVIPEKMTLNQWGLSGKWRVENEKAVSQEAKVRIAYEFHARDLHLVLGTGASRKPIQFRVLIDGKPPGADHGTDIDANGWGSITGEKLYQLVRQTGPVTDRSFEIEFASPGAEAFAFTFG